MPSCATLAHLDAQLEEAQQLQLMVWHHLLYRHQQPRGHAVEAGELNVAAGKGGGRGGGGASAAAAEVGGSSSRGQQPQQS